MVVAVSFALILAVTVADEPVYLAPEPKYRPSLDIPTRNCSVDFVKQESEVCVPTLQTECTSEEVVTKAPVETEKCFTVTATNCRASVRSEEVEFCVYVYERHEVEAEAKTPDVKYMKRCDTDYVKMCQSVAPSKYEYGKQHAKEVCQEVPKETCSNKPVVSQKSSCHDAPGVEGPGILYRCNGCRRRPWRGR